MKTLIIAGGIYKEDFVKEYICPDDYNYIIAVDKGLSYTEVLICFRTSLWEISIRLRTAFYQNMTVK